MGEILCEIRNELENASIDQTPHAMHLPPPLQQRCVPPGHMSDDQTPHAAHLPPPLQQQYVPPSQNVFTYNVNHTLNCGFRLTSEAPISSNRLAIPPSTETIADSSMLTQHPGT